MTTTEIRASTQPAADPPQAAAVAPAPSLAPSPALGKTAQAISDASRSMFRHANRVGMVPFHRAGLAAWLGNPVTGWQCLITTTGRRSGLSRPAPLGYLVEDGAAWVMAGYGPSTHWYQNVLAEPRVTLLLPGRPPVAALATEATDEATRARIIPRLCRSMALPGATIGRVPATSTDDEIMACVGWVPLVRIAPADGSTLAAGPDDPGGLGWIWRQALAVAVTILGVRALVRAARR
jgi:deazaflavin-dependent oxidoreductase (nitroreductase family)